VPTTYWAVAGGTYGQEPFLNWTLQMANSTDLPLVHSLSYGENEKDYSDEYEARMNLEFMKLGLRGITLLVATGDTGVQGAAQQGGSPPSCKPFLPVWPASSPYVTAVGGTQFSFRTQEACWTDVYSLGTPASINFACPDLDVGEIVSSADTGAMITSGGGFSNKFAMPAYQRLAVEEYLRQGNSTLTTGFLPPAEYFNATGRGYPDISAVGQNVPVVFNGTLQMTGGTSASTPIVAGIFALINDRRLASGKPPLGFINPWLYQTYRKKPQAFSDVKYGNNSGGNRLLPTYTSCEYGFTAIPGWDAASGLGSPDFLHLAASQPAERPPAPQPQPQGVSWATVLLAVVCSIIVTLAVTSSTTKACGQVHNPQDGDAMSTLLRDA